MSKKEKTVAEEYKSKYNDYGLDIALVNKMNPRYEGTAKEKEDKERDKYKSDDIKKLENAFKMINEVFFNNTLHTPVIEFSSKIRAEIKVEEAVGLISTEEIEKGTKNARLTKKIMISDRFLEKDTLEIYTALMNGIMIYADMEIAESKIGISGNEKYKKMFTGGGIYINKAGKGICKEYGILVEDGLYFPDESQESTTSERRYHFVCNKEGAFYKFLEDKELLKDQFVCRPLKSNNKKNDKGKDNGNAAVEDKGKKLFRLECPTCRIGIYVSKGNCEKDIRCFNEGCNGTRFMLADKK